MSEYRYEHEEALPDALRRPTTDYHAEYAARKARRERVSGHLQTQKSERQAAQDRADERLRRPLTSRDVQIYDQYTRFVDDGNKATSRHLRRADIRKRNMDEALQYSHAEYMERLSDEAYKLDGFVSRSINETKQMALKQSQLLPAELVWLIPLSQVPPYIVADLAPMRDFGPPLLRGWSCLVAFRPLFSFDAVCV